MVGVVERHYFSVAWLVAAEQSRSLAEQLAAGNERPPPDRYDQMRSHVICGVVAASAFMEAHINEAFDDASFHMKEWPRRKDAPRGPTHELQVRMAAVWPHAKQLRPLEKFDVALALADHGLIDGGSEPGQSAALLGRIRNYLLHYQPFPVRNREAEGEDARLSGQIRSHVSLPVWETQRGPLFPSRVLCPDLVRWSIGAAVHYVDEFCVRSGLFPGFNQVRPTWL